MAEGFAPDIADGILAGLLAGGVYAQLHTGPPGVDGTANVAATSTRMPAGFSAPSGGMASNTAALQWTAAATEDPTHISLWDAVSGGVFLRSGRVSGGPALVGTAYRVPIGQLLISLPVAS